MDKNKVNQLKNLLKRTNQNNSKTVKDETKEFLRSVDINDLVMAEQSLIEDGIGVENLRHLCTADLELMSEQTDNKMIDLSDEHPIKTLMLEHDEILSFLEQLELLNNQIQPIKKYQDLDSQLLTSLTNIAEHLVAAEKHHQREEDVLFPAIEDAGVFGPTQVMRAEHVDLRISKKALKKIAKKAKSNFIEFKTELDNLTKNIVFNLRDHIFKENNILYPTSLDVIKSQKTWDKIKVKCDEIGYCCFTPQYIKDN